MGIVSSSGRGEYRSRVQTPGRRQSGRSRPKKIRCQDEPVSTDLIERAGAGDERAFRELIEPYRRELHVHCYRLLGSVQDAEDALQETLLAAWRGLADFEGRSSILT